MNPADTIHGGTVEYLIYTDGKLIWQSGKITQQSPTKKVDVDLTGVGELKLVVTDAGDGHGWDWAVRANPVIR